MLVALAISLGATWLLVRYAHLHRGFTADSIVGPQKFHTEATPRIGGAAISIAFVGAAGASSLAGDAAIPRDAGLLFLCSLPALAGGIAEDLTKRISVGTRLAATMLAAGIAFFVINGVLHRLDVPGLDWALDFTPFALALTMVAVGGIANAINIVDGYNGLAGMISMFILAALAYVSHSVGDAFLTWSSLVMLGAVAGFMPWNYPNGRIFLGDGGAYFVGFMIGEISVLLVHRHPEVSPWFPLMLVAYPVWETLFSMYRKKIFHGYSPGVADGMHFHQLVYKRVMRWKVGSRAPTDLLRRNSYTSPYLWALSLTTIVPAVVFWRHTVILALWAWSFAFLYVWLYRRIVAFRAPRWLIFRRERRGDAVFAEDWTTDPRES